MIFKFCNIFPLQLQQMKKISCIYYLKKIFTRFSFSSHAHRNTFKKSVFFSLLMYAQVAGLNGTCCYMLEDVKRAKDMT